MEGWIGRSWCWDGRSGWWQVRLKGEEDETERGGAGEEVRKMDWNIYEIRE